MEDKQIIEVRSSIFIRFAKMDSADWCHYVMSIIILVMIQTRVEGLPGQSISDVDVLSRCRNITEAVDYLHACLPDHLPVDGRCKRYAALLSMAQKKGLPDKLSVVQLAELQGDILNLIYESSTRDELAALYMTLIDVYRDTELSPPFVEIVDCLGKIDTPRVRAFLNDRELVTILRLYRQALGPPATKVDLGPVDLTGFHPSFLVALGRMFRGHSELIDRRESQVDVSKGTRSISHRELSMQLMEKRERQRQLRIARQQSFRAKNLDRIRERDRLRKRRERIEIKRCLRDHKTASYIALLAPGSLSAPETMGQALSQHNRPDLTEEQLLEQQKLEESQRKLRLAQLRRKRYRERHYETLKIQERERHKRRREELRLREQSLKDQSKPQAERQENEGQQSTAGDPISNSRRQPVGDDSMIMQEQLASSDAPATIPAESIHNSGVNFILPPEHTLDEHLQLNAGDLAHKEEQSVPFYETQPSPTSSEWSIFKLLNSHDDTSNSHLSLDNQHTIDSDKEVGQTNPDPLSTSKSHEPALSSERIDTFDDLLNLEVHVDDPDLQAFLDDL